MHTISNLFDNPLFILKAQSAAVSEFKRFLHDDERVGFNNAWQRYLHPNTDNQAVSYYFRHREELEPRIDEIVKFTHHNRILESLRKWL